MISTPSARSSVRRELRAAGNFEIVERRAPNGLRAGFLPSGALFALRHQDTLINQFLPGPAEDGLARLLVRWRDPQGTQAPGWASLAGPGIPFAHDGDAIAWSTGPAGSGLACLTRFGLHPGGLGWAWCIRISNTGTAARRVEVLHAQDLGLADEAAVRNNEAYVSHYIDLLPVDDPALGPVVLARQNQPMAGGRRPWLAVACATGAAHFCTDGWQFFGADHRLTGEPAAVRQPTLPSRRLQYEFALAGLQSRAVELAPGASTEVVFVARFLADHPAASSAADVGLLHELCPASWLPAAEPRAARVCGGGVFVDAAWLHGSEPEARDWEAWFPGPRRHEETDARGTVLSFFHGAGTHVVSRAKEAAVARPHGHILRSGSWRWIDDEQFGVTCYAAGVFGAQAYLGNPNIARLLSVVRNHLGVARAGGQRVFMRRGDAWCQLGVPSAFAMETDRVRWIYRLGELVLEACVWCSRERPASFLELRVVRGPAQSFLITHQLALGANEFSDGGTLVVEPGAWIAALPSPASFAGKHLPGTCFAIAAADPAGVAALGGDELIQWDGAPLGGPYAAIETVPVTSCGVLLVGGTDGPAGLPDAVQAARAEFHGRAPAAAPPAPPLRLSGSSDAGVGRVDEVLPWMAHNAAIHFSAPHGLEQYGGAAWGVRDVTQGSLEWLLASGDLDTTRRMLLTVFAQQYAHDGSWPQWFMFPPFRFIQQAHSHGDVCLWPVKALCDYVEASNDFAFLGTPVGYTDHERFVDAGPREDLWSHCDRVVAHVESRFVPGTALINYGDGDWDDTLQPADPAMRTRMLSAWTVALAYQTIHQLATVAIRVRDTVRAARLNGLLERISRDFRTHLMPGGIVAGFLVTEAGGARPLLHPEDRVTGIRYRLLPMTRAIIAGLFTPEEAQRHLGIIERELRFPDGVRLMSDPVAYRGGLEQWFKRADTAANVGREIGLQYVHAHIRYAEALARVGDADRLWWALQVVNPVALAASVPNAAPRQSNVYFSSSDADFADRYEAAARWSDLRHGRVAARGGWRLYSSGPGLYLHKLRACLLGVRESFDDVIFDPVLPRSLDGLVASVAVCGHLAEVTYRVRGKGHGPTSIVVNGTPIEGTREPNSYRTGGLRVAASRLAGLLNLSENRIEITV